MQLVSFIISLLIVNSAFAYSSMVMGWGKRRPLKSSYIELYTNYWTTTKRFDSYGTQSELIEGDSFVSIAGGVKLTYSIFSKLQFKVDIAGRFNRYVTGSDTYDQSGAEYGEAAIKYLLPTDDKKWHWAIEASYRQKLFTNKDLTAIPLGDDQSEAAIKGMVTYYSSPATQWDFMVGYRRYAEVQSEEIPYGMRLALLGTHWDIYGGIRGIVSVKSDAYTGDEANKPAIGIVGTNLYNSVNQEYTDGYVGLVKKWRKWGVGIEGGTRFRGTSTDLGYWGGVKLIYRTSGYSSADIRRDQFKEYEIEGEVLKVSPRGKYVKVNIGLAQDLDSNMRIDIYKTDYFGTNILIATGVVQELRANWSIIRLVKKYKQVKIKRGWTARAY